MGLERGHKKPNDEREYNNFIMNTKKIRVAILFGGKSAEHEVSIQSAKNVYNSLDKKKYDVSLIGIDKEGEWHLCPAKYLLEASFAQQHALDWVPSVSLVTKDGRHGLVDSDKGKHLHQIDVVFPVLHGPFGEDGSMQGLLTLSNLPFVGSGVLGSAIGMDKDVTKRLLRDAGLPIAKFLVYRKGESVSFDAVKNQLGLPCFVKPANLGSSVGVSKVQTEKQLRDAVTDAFTYDTKILIEEFVPGREIECSVLGNEKPIVSIPGEIIATHDFYSYEAKYLDENGATLTIPANLSQKKIKEVQELALKTFSVLCLEGMARIDCFLTPEGKFYINEANTIPGFTNISMYPKLWEASGISYSELVGKLIQFAIERHENQQSLKTSL